MSRAALTSSGETSFSSLLARRSEGLVVVVGEGEEEGGGGDAVAGSMISKSSAAAADEDDADESESRNEGVVGAGARARQSAVVAPLPPATTAATALRTRFCIVFFFDTRAREKERGLLERARERSMIMMDSERDSPEVIFRLRHFFSSSFVFRLSPAPVTSTSFNSPLSPTPAAPRTRALIESRATRCPTSSRTSQTATPWTRRS